MSETLRAQIENYRSEYLDTSEGQKHLATLEAEIKEVQEIFGDIARKSQAGNDITEDVLRHLLPHSDTQHNRAHGYRTSTWPCITKDIRTWFENSGWKRPEDWPPTARMIVEGIHGLIRGSEGPWQDFLDSEYKRGFGTGFLSPILFCLDPQRFLVINSKVLKTYRFCSEQLGNPDTIDATLANYLTNVGKVCTLQEQLAPLGLRTIQEFDIFCHFVVSKRLGGGDLTIDQMPEYVAWLFVANPAIYEWEQAFPDNGVEWTGSLGHYAQKLLRQHVKVGDPVYGYQAGPDYSVQCELKVAAAPYKVSTGTWAVRLAPIRRLTKPISLATLKGHPVLSELAFVRQAQRSISGITQEQHNVLQTLLSEVSPPIVAPLPLPSPDSIDALCAALQVAQCDTAHPDELERLLAKAFTALGLDAEHIGGSGRADVVVTGQIGEKSYTAIVDAKTCAKGASLSLSVGFDSIYDHREENTADYALVVAPAYSRGKLAERAARYSVGLVTVDALVKILRHHDQFPYSIVELRRLFEVQGLAADIAGEMGRVHSRHDAYLQLVGQVLEVFDSLQRKQDTSEPINGGAIFLALTARAIDVAGPLPSRKEINDIIALLSNPVLDLLAKEDDGYVLTLSIEAAKRRVLALADFFSIGD